MLQGARPARRVLGPEPRRAVSCSTAPRASPAQTTGAPLVGRAAEERRGPGRLPPSLAGGLPGLGGPRSGRAVVLVLRPGGVVQGARGARGPRALPRARDRLHR